jgi:hypothetical protein
MIDFVKNPSNQEVAGLNDLIKKCTDLFNPDGSLSGENILRAQWLENALMYQIIQSTNFDSIFEILKMSYHRSTFPFIHQVLSEMKTNGVIISLSNMIERINQEVDKLEKEPLKIYRFLIPCRLKLELNNSEIETLTKMILDVTDVQIINNLPEKYLAQIKEGKFKRFFTWGRSILSVDVEARDLLYAEYIAEKKLLCILGFIGFVNHYKRTTVFHWSIDGNEAFCQNPIEKRAAVFENDSLIIPDIKSFSSLEFQIKDSELSLMQKESWVVNNTQNGNYQDLLHLLSFSKSHNENNQVIKDSLRIYFSAITETLPELSFLKFWISFEVLLKKGGKIKNTKVVLDKWKKAQNKYPEKIIESLYQKRCDLAHEYKTDFISTQEVTFAKDIAETTLLNIDKIWM